MTGPFEEMVREAMAVRRMGLRELCRQAGLDPSFFSKVLAGKRSPPADDCVRKVAKVLGLDGVRLIAAAGRIPREWSRLCRDEEACRRVSELASADPGSARPSPAPAAPAAGAWSRRRVSEVHPPAAPGHNWKARDRGESRAPYPTAPSKFADELL